MAITSTGLNAATVATNATANTAANTALNKTTLGKDAFMKLLLVQLQYQDPTSPMNAEKILTQTSQLAALESTDKTNKALTNLAASLGNTQQFSTIAAIGKTANLGSDAISLNKGTKTTFEIYFPKDVQQGSVVITDANGNTVKTLDVGAKPKGVYQFTWDGSNNIGAQADSGVYHVNANYSDPNGTTLQTKLGTYPIKSVRFDKGKALVQVGSNYVPLDKIKEVF